MFLNIHQLEYCLEKAREFTDYYNQDYLAADDPRRYVEHLHDICQRRMNVSVRLLVLEIPEAKSPVKAAFFVRGNGKYEIAVVKGLNLCWRRFVFCKELFHVVMDRENQSRDMDLAAHIAGCVVSFPAGADGEEPSIAVQSEVITEIAAMEFLFPYSCRKSELAGPLNGQFFSIADKYKVPQVYVERYLSENYMEALKAFA